MGRRHLEAYLRIPDVAVEACSDVNAEALKFLDSKNVKCRQYRDWEEMLRNETLDVLSVVTNGPAHAEITIAAANAKVPRVICEKPMATTIEDALKMIDSVNSNGTRLAINFSRRWSKDYAKLKAIIKNGTIGTLRQVHCVCGGGQLAMNGSHFLDLMRYLSDSEPVSVTGWIDKAGTPNPRGTQFQDPGGLGVVRFVSGMRGFIDMYEDLGVPPRIELVGSIGYVMIDEVRNRWVVEHREEKDRLAPLGRYDLPLKTEELATNSLDPTRLVEETIREILTDGTIACTGLDGLAALQMLIAFHVSENKANTTLTLPVPEEYNSLEIRFG